MDYQQKILKRFFDFWFSLFSLALLLVPIIIMIIIASIECKGFGLFFQKRVGKEKKLFTVVKIRTISISGKISRFSRFLRSKKLDELPQLLNILVGNMSFVGPRPDLPGYLDVLKGENEYLTTLKPGLTSPASLKFFDEEELLAMEESAKEYYNEVIWPQKVAMNMAYFKNASFSKDIGLILNTLYYCFFRKELFSFSDYYVN